MVLMFWWYSPQEAKDNLKDAVELYLENAKELGMLDVRDVWSILISPQSTQNDCA